MKATGIVRRIDDLGRVVIPKEIRRMCRIREGDALEIYTLDGAVVFKKYSPIGMLDEVTRNLCDHYQNKNKALAFFDDDGMIFQANIRYGSINGKIGLSDEIMDARAPMDFLKCRCVPIFNNGILYGWIAGALSDEELKTLAQCIIALCN